MLLWLMTLHNFWSRALLITFFNRKPRRCSLSYWFLKVEQLSKTFSPHETALEGQRKKVEGKNLALTFSKEGDSWDATQFIRIWGGGSPLFLMLSPTPKRYLPGMLDLDSAEWWMHVGFVSRRLFSLSSADGGKFLCAHFRFQFMMCLCKIMRWHHNSLLQFGRCAT